MEPMMKPSGIGDRLPTREIKSRKEMRGYRKQTAP
jgi:hypothetical protein